MSFKTVRKYGARVVQKSANVIAKAAAIGTPAALAVGQAQAAVPTGVQTIFTDAATDFGTVVAYGWTAFAVITGGLVLFGIVKKVVSRSTR